MPDGASFSENEPEASTSNAPSPPDTLGVTVVAIVAVLVVSFVPALVAFRRRRKKK
jgi:ABC-type transport system involved in multi-copper enzyme maturation permease subunit